MNDGPDVLANGTEAVNVDLIEIEKKKKVLDNSLSHFRSLLGRLDLSYRDQNGADSDTGQNACTGDRIVNFGERLNVLAITRMLYEPDHIHTSANPIIPSPSMMRVSSPTR